MKHVFPVAEWGRGESSHPSPALPVFHSWLERVPSLPSLPLCPLPLISYPLTFASSSVSLSAFTPPSLLVVAPFFWRGVMFSFLVFGAQYFSCRLAHQNRSSSTSGHSHNARPTGPSWPLVLTVREKMTVRRYSSDPIISRLSVARWTPFDSLINYNTRVEMANAMTRALTKTT